MFFLIIIISIWNNYCLTQILSLSNISIQQKILQLTVAALCHAISLLLYPFDTPERSNVLACTFARMEWNTTSHTRTNYKRRPLPALQTDHGCTSNATYPETIGFHSIFKKRNQPFPHRDHVQNSNLPKTLDSSTLQVNQPIKSTPTSPFETIMTPSNLEPKCSKALLLLLHKGLIKLKDNGNR